MSQITFVAALARTGLAAGLAVGLSVAGTVPATAQTQITISQYGQLLTGLPWFVATERGMLQEVGIDPEFVSGHGGGESLRNMMASNTQFGELATASVIAAIERNVDLVLVYSNSHEIGDLHWVSMPGSGIETIEDLAGRNVAYTNPRSATEMTVRLALEAAGVEAGELTAAGGLGAALTALRNGMVDAAPIVEPVMTNNPDDFHVLFRIGDVVPVVTWGVGVVSREFAQNNPQVVTDLIRVRRDAVRWIYDNPDEASPYLARYLEIDEGLASTLLVKFLDWGYLSEGEFNLEGLDTVVRGLELMGAFEGQLDWANYINQDFLPEDLQRTFD